MSVTVAAIYQQVCYDLLEDSGLALGLVTQAEFLDVLGEVLIDFLRRTGMIRTTYSQQVLAGVTVYTYPDFIPEVYYAFYNAKILETINISSNLLVGNWRLHPTTPIAWHQDGLPINSVELVPPPALTGSSTAPVYNLFLPGQNNLSMIGSQLASKETWGGGDTLDTIPDSFTPYLSFGILQRIFSKEGEEKDLRRADYCKTRYEEGVMLGKSILLRMEKSGQQ